MKCRSALVFLLALPSLASAFVAQGRPAVSVKLVTQKSPFPATVPVRVPLTSTAAEVDEPTPEEDPGLGKKLFDAYVKTADVATTLFPLWTVLFTGIALKSPAAFDWFTTDYFTGALAALMLSMGITLTPDDFVAVAKEPTSVFMQFTLCYAMMPVLALFLGRFFGLDPALMAGMVLVGSVNGGQASNLCTYIAKGNVALSVLMTTATTIGAIFMTPTLCKGLLGAVVPVDAIGIAKSTVEVVLAPIAIGMSLNKFFPKFVKKILPFAPVVGVVSTCLLVASAIAQVADPIKSAGMALQIPVLFLHLLGGLVGYGLPRFCGFDEISSRTMAIETSMKSSAFGFLLAKLHFGDYAARVPSAVSVFWMALTGSILAVIWRYIPVKEPTGDEVSPLKKCLQFVGLAKE
ncbi:Sodium/pyruvate cotransporter BASS2, chloroplastic [Seminavis robusta]|uniref:Sodium/pyruvate cotransporter BASS2, chloroplastic n=1 Tax=Seminavis robusta TaxID=568900 RepID=A0A9N8EWM3_9STRA|nr:Sodium/pyruvate cotransporter BASS2, chloroplastic [Seminavis robusta]|eukprot:Sro1822_g299790.1 Sodium/pyruvate cotransporter BASS2, chloroplastic (405) ;mRNA; r:858-2472